MAEKTYLFLSDCHLSEKHPERTKMLCHKLLEHGIKKDIYILGDLFDAWIGDDTPNLWLNNLFSTCKLLSQQQSNIFIMHGNHDFLIGSKIIEKMHAKFIQDPFILNGNILLTHGDDLCLNDKAYQRLKPIIQSKIIKKIFLKLPRSQRKSIAKKLQGNGAPKGLDQNKIEQLTINSKVKTLIHGHTHFPYINGTTIGLGSWEKGYSILQLKGHDFNWL